MSAWGKGDPRWIVEERADATNVNNWHWTEKNATPWSKKTLTELLTFLAFEDESGHCRTTSVESIEGEAVANNRKAKLIFFYELEVKLNWEGKTTDGQDVRGQIFIPNLSEENDPDEIEVQVSMKSESTPERRKVKELLRIKGTPAIQDQIGKYIKLLKTEFSKDMILPSKGAPAPQLPGVKLDAKTAQQLPQQPADLSAPKPKAKQPEIATKTPAVSTAAPPPKVKTKTVEVTDEFLCPPDALYDALTNPDKVSAYTQSECKMDAKAGGEFSMFGGNVTGSFSRLDPNKLIEQSWRFKSWPEGHYSKVKIELSPQDGNTKLSLTQTDVPESDYGRTKEGWTSHQFNRMKAIFGFGSPMGLF
eukprot:m.95532 g.95532  ORF g.95532 m.95532 type:complete len:362 (+) comp21927_c0_seq2:80-1165(+)